MSEDYIKKTIAAAALEAKQALQVAQDAFTRIANMGTGIANVLGTEAQGIIDDAQKNATAAVDHAESIIRKSQGAA